MVLSSDLNMPQTVPSASYSPPLDYSVFAADYFDLSLLPSPELSFNDIPLSPSTGLYTAPSSPVCTKLPPAYTFKVEYTPLISNFKEEPFINFPISPPPSHSSYSNHSSPIYPQSASPICPIKTEFDLEEFKEFEDIQKPKDYQLLREVLKDTSFQKKYNLKPFDFGSTFELETSIKLEDPPEMEEKDIMEGQLEGDIEPVLSLAFEQMQKEVTNTCCVLGISTDPTLWSASDVKAWLLWTTQQFNLPPIQIDYFNMDGQILAGLTEEEFTQRAPQSGCVLHAQLEIWKAACLETEIARASNDSPTEAPLTISMPMLTPTSPIPVTVNTLQPNDSNGSSITSWSNNPASTPSSGEISDEDDVDMKPPTPVKPAPGKATSSRTTTGGSHIHLWQFLKELLNSPTLYGSAIRWLDRPKGVFKIEDSVRVARLWGKRKNRPAMNYDKLSRSIRQYYKKGIMKKTERSQRLVYQFCHPYCL